MLHAEGPARTIPPWMRRAGAWAMATMLLLAPLGLAGCGGSDSDSAAIAAPAPATARDEAAPRAAGDAGPAQAARSPRGESFDLEAFADHENPAELIMKFIRQPILDEYNPDVTDENRHADTPRRGGVLRVRSPADFAELNPLTVNGQPEREFLNLLSDSLVGQDPRNLQYFPLKAWAWDRADLLQLAGGEVQEGVLLELGDESDPDSEVVFVPGARKRVFAKFDVASVADDRMSLTLTDERGGHTYDGYVLELAYTFEVNEALDPAREDSIIRTTIGGLATWRDIEGTPRDRPFRKQECSFRFHIREGITWHDGRPFTAEDVKFTYDTLMNTHIQGAAPFRALIEPYVTSCEIINEGQSVHILAHKPYFQLFDAIVAALPPIPKHVFDPDQFGGDDRAFADAFQQHPFRENPILSGPYRLAQWRRGDSLLAVRNDDYWASKLPQGAVGMWTPEQPYLDAIRVIVIGEKSVALGEIQRGSLDVDKDIEADIWFNNATNRREFTDRFVRANFQGFGYTYVGWNHQRPIFQDRDTRRALAMLIPRDRILEDIHQGLHRAVTGPFFIDGPGYDHSIEPIPYNPREAQRLLRRAGWLDRTGDGILEKEIDGRFVPLEFEYMIHNARDYHQKVADIVKESVEQAGIRMTIRRLDWSVYADETRSKNFDAVRFAWGASVEPDPFSVWHSSQAREGGNNFISFIHPRIDEICEQIREEFNPLRRWALAREMHHIVHEEQPVFFMFAFTNQAFYPRGIRGVYLYPSSYPMNFREWWWADEQRRAEQPVVGTGRRN